MRKLFYTMMIAALTVANVWAQEGTIPTITLTTEKGVGETLELYIDATLEDAKDIWIDLDGNGVRNPDGNEDLQVGPHYSDGYKGTYTIKVSAGTPIKIHGLVKGFNCSNKSTTSLENNQITALDLSEASTKLEKVNCANNKIKKLNVANLRNLKELNCNNNTEIAQLFLDNNKNLEKLECEGTDLSILDISTNTELIRLVCKATNLSSLDVSKNTKLEFLKCDHNKQLTSLSDLAYNKMLKDLFCNNTSITGLNVTECSRLETLWCYENPNIKGLDVSNCTKLVYLNCSQNGLSLINVDNNNLLRDFYCSGNDIKEINLTNNTELETFGCLNNPLTALDFSTNKKIYYIQAWDTNMDACALDNMYKSLPNRPETRKGSIWVKNTASPTSHTKTASDKNWTVIDETGDGTGCQPTNIDLQESNNVVSVYPNPATDYITVSLPDSAQGGSLVIADLSGKTVVAEPITDTQLNVRVAHLAKGVYIVKVGSTVEKLIVK